MNLGSEKIRLKHFLSQLDLPRKGIWKCRITYSNNITKCEIQIYKAKIIRRLKVVSTEDLDYSHKWADRKKLEQLFAERDIYDDIIISQNGFVKDSYYANLLFYRKGVWYTPKSPLLKGVQRAKLLKDGTIVEKDIMVDQIRKYKKIKLVNAMIDFKDAKSISTTRVYY